MVKIAAADFTPRVIRNRKLHNGYTVIGRPETFGERLGRLRREHGWSPRDLAQRAGVGYTTIWQAEHDRREVMSDTIIRLAHTLGVPVCELLLGMSCEGAS